MTMNIFAADTETLGLQPAIHRVIELSFARGHTTLKV